MRLFVDFCVFPRFSLNLPELKLKLFWTAEENNFRCSSGKFRKKRGGNTEINKQSHVKFWFNRKKYGAVSYSLSCISLLSLERRLSQAKRTDLANALFGMLLRVWTNLTVKPPQYYIQYTYLAPAQTYIPSCFRREPNWQQTYKSEPSETGGRKIWVDTLTLLQLGGGALCTTSPSQIFPTALLVGVMSHALRYRTTNPLFTLDLWT